MPNFVLVGLAAAVGVIVAAAALYFRIVKEMATSGARGIMLLALMVASAAGSGVGAASLTPTEPVVGAVLGAIFASFIIVATLLPARGAFWIGKIGFTALSTLAGGIMVFSVINFSQTGGEATQTTGRQIAQLTIGSAEAIQGQLEGAKLQQSEHAKTIAFARDALRQAEQDIAEDRASKESGAELARLEALQAQPLEGTAAHDAWRAQLRQFQADRGLAQDGIYGARTRAEISAAKLRAQRAFEQAAGQMETRRQEATAALKTALAMQDAQAKRIEGLQQALAKYTDTAVASVGAQQTIISSVSRGKSWSIVMGRISPFSDTTDSNIAMGLLIAGAVDLAVILLSLTLAAPLRAAVNDNPAPVQRPAPRIAAGARPEPAVARPEPAGARPEPAGARPAVAETPRKMDRTEPPFARQVVASAAPKPTMGEAIARLGGAIDRDAIAQHYQRHTGEDEETLLAARLRDAHAGGKAAPLRRARPKRFGRG